MTFIFSYDIYIYLYIIILTIHFNFIIILKNCINNLQIDFLTIYYYFVFKNYCTLQKIEEVTTIFYRTKKNVGIIKIIFFCELFEIIFLVYTDWQYDFIFIQQNKLKSAAYVWYSAQYSTSPHRTVL